MRPIQLEVEGFGTFRERTVVNFANTDLIALVGPTGSGKSTIIDAVTFALYGSVARYDNPARVAPVIHQLATEARVRLDFELAEKTYTAVRVVRRAPSAKGKPVSQRANTKEARLELAGAGTASAVLAGSVTELDAEVERLIGLNFTQFTKTIVLPQGEFAQLLTDDPSNRQQLIRRLLDIDIYARMGQRAREQASQAAQQVTAYQGQLARLDAVRPDDLTVAKDRVAALASLADTATDLLDQLTKVASDLTTNRDHVNLLDRALAALGAVTVPAELEAVGETTAAARAAMADAEAAQDAARQQRDDAAEALEAIGDPFRLQELMQARQRFDDITRAISILDTALTHARTDLDEAASRQSDAQQAAQAAGEALREARTGVDAAVWVARLQAGEPCPICRQPVAELFHLPTEHDLSTAGAEAEAVDAHSQKLLAEARTATATAEGRLRSVETDLARHRNEATQLGAKLDGVGNIDELQAAIAAASKAAEHAKSTAAALRQADAALKTAAAQVRKTVQAEQQFRQGFNNQRDAVQRDAVQRDAVQRDAAPEQRPPAPGGESLVDDWRALHAWAVERVEAVSGERDRIVATTTELEATSARLTGELAAAAGPLGVDPGPARLQAALARAQAKAEAKVEQLSRDLDHKQELTEQVGALEEQKTVYEGLGQHLAAHGFERWLLEEALDIVVERATARLLELSSGRYSLEADDGAFWVRDHTNADERRGVRTLSGGEIFLASLALALALSESVADLAAVDGPQLGSIFLDEGFGTLDASTLDIVAAAIEELSAAGRLVAIVTHVRELAERMPVRFEVTKNGSTSAVERVEL